MTLRRTLAAACSTAALLCLAACGSPCSKHEGTVDGYCNGTVAMNCRTTCADCIDEWKLQACPSQCTVVEAKPVAGELVGQDPNMDQPAKWAICSTN